MPKIFTGTKVGVINASEIDVNGILPITQKLGNVVTLDWEGTSDLEITGFGNYVPEGYTFKIYIPRTIADVGAGGVNNLNRYVQFIHTSSGDGLDLTMNKKMDGSSVLYTYQAYPNATDRNSNFCALHEQLEFLHEGAGRWKLIGLPSSLYKELVVDGDHLWSVYRDANGYQSITGQFTRNYTYSWSQNGWWISSMQYPGSPVNFSSGAARSVQSRDAAWSPYTTYHWTHNGIGVRVRSPSSWSGTVSVSVTVLMNGGWKPLV